MITDEEYTAWLKSDHKHPVALATINAKDSDGVAITLYLGTTTYRTLSHTYRGRLADIESEWDMGGGISGASEIRWGSLFVVNGDGALDDWKGYRWGGTCTIIFGDENWDVTDFRTIFDGNTNGLEVSPDQLEIFIADAQEQMNTDVPTGTISGGANDGKRNTEVWGHCLNVTIPLLDDATFKYGLGQAVDSFPNIYVDGKLITSGITRVASSGYFTFSADPAGLVTADVKGHKNDATWVSKPAEIALALLTRSGGPYTTGDLDTASFTAVDTEYPFICGVVIDKAENYISVLDRLFKGLLIDYGPARNGKITLRMLDAPSGTSTLDVGEKQMYGLPDITHIAPKWRIVVKYGKNHTVIETPDSTVSQNHKTFLGAEWDYDTKEDSSVLTNYEDAKTLTYETALKDKADATTLSVSLFNLFSVPRSTLLTDISGHIMETELNDTIKITSGRYGFESGKNAVVIGMREKAIGSQQVEVWL